MTHSDSKKRVFLITGPYDSWNIAFSKHPYQWGVARKFHSVFDKIRLNDIVILSSSKQKPRPYNSIELASHLKTPGRIDIFNVGNITNMVVPRDSRHIFPPESKKNINYSLYFEFDSNIRSRSSIEANITDVSFDAHQSFDFYENRIDDVTNTPFLEELANSIASAWNHKFDFSTTFIPSDDQHNIFDQIPKIVHSEFEKPGKTIPQLESEQSKTLVGDNDQIQFKTKPVWHNKRDMDKIVAEKLNINPQKWGEDKSQNYFYKMVAKSISELREKGEIIDFKKGMPRYGIWRLNSISGKKFEELTIEEKSKQVSSFLLQGLQQPGRTIRELDLNRYSGNDASRPIWHRLNEIRLFTAQKAGVSKIDPRKVRDNFGVGLEFDKIFDHEFLTLQNSGKLVFFNNIHTLFRLRDSFEDTPKDINIKNKSKLLKDEQLPLLDSEDIEKGFELISNELLMSKEKILEIIIALASGRHVLLAGPIGTGKTQLAKLIPKYFWKKWGGYFSEDHTATSDWSTLDVIGGIMPTMDGDKPKYIIQDGCVVDTVSKNWDDEGNRIPTENPDEDTSYRGTWLIIDEFNRADIDKAFGQLFTSLRTRELKIPTDEEDELFEKLKIPKDYRIIGTLNTADKHFLFNLSDALKSRFAYIEVDIPSRDESETEIYYALNNALKELELDESFEKIVLDHDGKKINKEQSDSDLYNRIQQAYVFLDTVRIFKKLGTAVLKLIYQNLIVGSQLSDNSLLSLDNALTSNLIPQLENLDSSKVGTIHALHSGGLVSFFKNAYDDLNKQSYLKPFENILDYLDIPEKSQLVSNFKKGNIPNDAEFWKTLQVSYDEKKKDFEMELTQIKQALIELKNSRVI